MQFTERAKALVSGWTGKGVSDDSNPFVREPGAATYMRFDTIRIESASDVLGGVNVCYSWRGHDILYMRQEGVGLKDNNTLTIAGIEGRMNVWLSGV